ncbi:Beta-1,3-galactosyltransferase 4 [Armadillidium vulgare]|nr:Beta-1,3-galactosyltransferase 4 [Armadillidium vulgare]
MKSAKCDSCDSLMLVFTIELFTIVIISKYPEEKLKTPKENRKSFLTRSKFSKHTDDNYNNNWTSKKTNTNLLHIKTTKYFPTLITDDYYYPKFIRHKLFSDVFNTSFIKIPPKEICHIESRSLFLINSGSKNNINRKYFRFHIQKHNINASWVFLTSISPSDSHYHSLLKEADKFNDLIVTSYPDSYETLTEKIGSGFLWILKNCFMVETVLKTDDDVFINFNLFNKTLHENILNFTIFGKQNKTNKTS